MRSPADVLERIPGFAGARVIGQLSDGPTNASYEAEQGGERYVLRIDKPAASEFGLDRAAELEVIDVLVHAGLAENPIHYDTKSGVYLRTFKTGRSWAETDLQNTSNLERLANLLCQVHSLPPVGRAFDPVASARGYAEQLGTVEAKGICRELEKLVSTQEAISPTLCHNDLVHTNILESDRLALIDWEWGGAGDPYFDLAIVVQHHGLNVALNRHFLAAYLGEEPSEGELARLNSQCRIYGLLLNLWNAL